MKARNISRIRSTEEDGGRDPLTLESNAVELDILAEDPAWAATELAKIEEELSARVVDTPEWNAAFTRLELFRSAWQGRRAEVKAAFGKTPQAEAATLEQALASALTHARNWKLSPAEIERLRQGCLTDQCRDIADGKMSLGL